MLFAGVHFQRNRFAVSQAQRGFKTFREALAGVVKLGAHRVGHIHRFIGYGRHSSGRVPHLDAVNHHINVVFFGFFELGQVVKLIRLALHAKPHITLRLHFGKHVFKLALAVTRHRRQDHQLGVFRQRQHRVDHLAHALGLQRQIMLGAKRRAGSGIQQAQVVVNLRHRAHGGARVVAGGFLLDGNRRRQALDHVHIGLVHQLQKLPRIGGQALNIAALAFSVQRVKRQAGLARAAQAGDDHQLVARNVEVNVFEVVRACAANADGLGGED